MTTKRTPQSEHWKFKWSHHARPHRMLVRVFNLLMRSIPFSWKYGVGKRMRRGQLPYTIAAECRVIVQVGAPQDILYAGRSRGYYFALFAPETKVVIIEPDPESIQAFRQAAVDANLQNIHLIDSGVWSQQTILEFYINPAHPAANFTAGTKEYDAQTLREYHILQVPVDTLDHLLEPFGLDQIDLVSITTNGAEPEILKGLQATMDRGLQYIALARTGDGYFELMDQYGYDFLSHDDRGYIFERRSGE